MQVLMLALVLVLVLVLVGTLVARRNDVHALESCYTLALCGLFKLHIA